MNNDFIEGQLSNYVNEMKKDSTYGDHVTLLALSRLYNVQFLIVSADGPEYSVFISSDGSYSQQTFLLTLGYFPEGRGEHYVSIAIGRQLTRELLQQSAMGSEEEIRVGEENRRSSSAEKEEEEEEMEEPEGNRQPPPSLSSSEEDEEKEMEGPEGKRHLPPLLSSEEEDEEKELEGPEGNRQPPPSLSSSEKEDEEKEMEGPEGNRQPPPSLLSSSDGEMEGPEGNRQSLSQSFSEEMEETGEPERESRHSSSSSSSSEEEENEEMGQPSSMEETGRSERNGQSSSLSEHEIAGLEGNMQSSSSEEEKAEMGGFEGNGLSSFSEEKKEGPKGDLLSLSEEGTAGREGNRQPSLKEDMGVLEGNGHLPSSSQMEAGGSTRISQLGEREIQAELEGREILPREIQSMIIHHAIRISPVSRFDLQNVNTFFRQVVTSVPSPRIHINWSVLPHVPYPVSVRKLVLTAGRSSGLVMEIKKILADPRWIYAWLWLKEDRYRNFYITRVSYKTKK